MNITIREQVLAALRNNPGLNSVKLAELIGMDTRKISGTVSTLLADGMDSFDRHCAHGIAANRDAVMQRGRTQV